MTHSTRFLIPLVVVLATVNANSSRTVPQATQPEPAAVTPAAHKELARRYARDRSFADAIHEYQAVLASAPNDGDARLHIAELLAWTGDYDHSLVAYEDLLRSSPNNLEARIGLARVLRWSHRYADSVQQLEIALKEDPQNLDGIKGIAQTYALVGDFDKSLAYLDRGLSLFPQDAELIAQKGTVLSWSGNLQDGISCLQRAVSLDPTSATAYRSLADAYTWHREYSKGAENYRKALDIEPKSVETAFDLAKAYQKAGKRTLAEEVVGQILRTNPTHHQALALLQEIRRDGRLESARAMDIWGEPIAFVAILCFPTWVIYRRQRRTIWHSPLYRKLYRVIFPIFSLLFLVAYALRIIFETNTVYKTAEIVLLAGIFSLAVLIICDHKPATEKNKGPTVLIVGAHPDDIELGAAGAALKLAQEGADVYGLVLTQGEVGSSAPVGTRTSEAFNGARHLALVDLWVLNFPDTKMRQHIADLRSVIEKKIKELGVQIVITHGPHETHGDHTAVFEAAREAGRSCSMLCFESISAPKEFVPNYFVDITQYLPDKLLAIGSHKTQRNKFYMDPELVKGRAAHRGLQAGVPYAEAFWVYRWVR